MSKEGFDKINRDTVKNALDAEDLYEQAREMTEQALEAYIHGDKETGDQLIEEAREVSPAAVQDVYEELEEDAASRHDTTALNGEN